MTPWRVLTSRLLVERRFLRVREDHIRQHSGVEFDDFCVIESPPWVAVVCVTDRDELLLVRQYRHGIGRASLELPAGGLEPDETPLAGAQRELREETGCSPPHWESLGVLAMDPSRHATWAHFFFARGGRCDAPLQLDHGEELSVVAVHRRDARRLALSGEICHGLHVAALLRAEALGLL